MYPQLWDAGDQRLGSYDAPYPSLRHAERTIKVTSRH